jgi:hypothetical protein
MLEHNKRKSHLAPTAPASTVQEKLREHSPPSNIPITTEPRAEPRAEPRNDPRSSLRSEPRNDPRADPRIESRGESRSDPRNDPRSSYNDPRNDPRHSYNDPRYAPQNGSSAAPPRPGYPERTSSASSGTNIMALPIRPPPPPTNAPPKPPPNGGLPQAPRRRYDEVRD